MEQELHSWLHFEDKEQLIYFLEELVRRHPFLRTEIADMLAGIPGGAEPGEELTEDWDFSGENSYMPPRSAPLPLESEIYRQRIEQYAARLQQGELLQTIIDDVADLFSEAEARAEYQDDAGALGIYALALDERLRERDAAFTSILDKALVSALPTMKSVLPRAARTSGPGGMLPAQPPLLTTNARWNWLERLFAFWLKHLDVRDVEEQVLGSILSVAWPEDMAPLWNLVQSELQKQPYAQHINIVDFTHLYRVRALEKFLQTLPAP
ncbi:MAG: hypothetical protein ABI456_14185 [Ktedonobacteraceae bacterium]|nr:hypothetical protein [Chloroflexota bacterium]